MAGELIMFEWIADVFLAQNHWAKFDQMKPGDSISLASDPNMQEDMEPYRVAFIKRFTHKSFIVWTVKDSGRWIIHFKRLA